MTRPQTEHAAIACILLAFVVITAGICALLANQFFIAACAAITGLGLSLSSVYFRSRAEAMYEQERLHGSWMRRPL